jgi:hypothetical protein
MIHVVTHGIDVQTFVRILLSYLRSWGDEPFYADATNIAPDDFAAWDNLLTHPCCVLLVRDPDLVSQWLAESQAQFCWYHSLSPPRSELVDAIAHLKSMRHRGGRAFPLLSERLFQPSDLPDAIYIPALDVSPDLDLLGLISDRATPPQVRQALAKKLDEAYGKLAHYRVQRFVALEDLAGAVEEDGVYF